VGPEDAVDPQRHTPDPRELRRGGQLHHPHVVVVDHRVAKRIGLVVELDDRLPDRCALLESGALGQAARDHVAHDRLDLDDVEPAAEHLAVGERPEVVRRHLRALEPREHRCRHPVVDDTLADDRAALERVEGRGVVLEVLDDQFRVVRGVDDLGLALVELLARLDVHRRPPRAH